MSCCLFSFAYHRVGDRSVVHTQYRVGFTAAATEETSSLPTVYTSILKYHMQNETTTLCKPAK